MTLSPITLKKFFFLLRDNFPFNDKVIQDCHTAEPTIKLQTETQELGFLMDVAVTSSLSAQRGYLYLSPPSPDSMQPVESQRPIFLPKFQPSPVSSGPLHTHQAWLLSSC